MSRFRFGYAVVCFGILITTGGCSSSATAPEATAEHGSISADRATNPTDADTEQGKPDDDGTVTGQSGYISVGG